MGTLRILSYNCYRLKSSTIDLHGLCDKYDIVFFYRRPYYLNMSYLSYLKCTHNLKGWVLAQLMTQVVFCRAVLMAV